MHPARATASARHLHLVVAFLDCLMLSLTSARSAKRYLTILLASGCSNACDQSAISSGSHVMRYTFQHRAGRTTSPLGWLNQCVYSSEEEYFPDGGTCPMTSCHARRSSCRVLCSCRVGLCRRIRCRRPHQLFSRKIHVCTAASTLNDTLPVEPLFLIQTERGDPLCLQEARRCFFNAEMYLLAHVSSVRQLWSSHTVCERYLRSWTSHSEIKSVLSLKGPSSRSLYGVRTKRYRVRN
jgi:hypothetical protein